jgi:hypothetical protein
MGLGVRERGLELVLRLQVREKGLELIKGGVHTLFRVSPWRLAVERRFSFVPLRDWRLEVGATFNFLRILSIEISSRGKEGFTLFFHPKKS